MTANKSVPGVGGIRYIVRDKDGHELGEGDTVTSGPNSTVTVRAAPKGAAMNTTARDLADRYAALPESIRSKCPRPTTAVTPEKVRAWLVEVRNACLTAAAGTTDLALVIARGGDLGAAVSLKAEATEALSFAAAVGDLIGYPPVNTGNGSEVEN